MLRRRAKALEHARVYPVGALTVKLEGERLTEMAQLAEAGCVAFSQANVPLTDTQVLWRALQYAATFGFPVWLRAEDTWLAKGGVAHDGEIATRLVCRHSVVRRNDRADDAARTRARHPGSRARLPPLHRGRVEMMRAKREGLPVTCDVGIHHLHLCDNDLGYFRFQLPPRAAAAQPARSRCALGRPAGRDDRLRLLGPHAGRRRRQAPAVRGSGARRDGLELLLPLTLKWGEARKLPLVKSLAKITSDAARVLGVARASSPSARPADVVLFDRRQRAHLGRDAEEPGQEHAVPRLRARRARAHDDRRRQRWSMGK